MKIILKLLLPTLLLAPFFLTLGGCGCGFDCNDSNNNNSNDPAALTLGFSDSIPEDLKQVVIEVDAITFRRTGADDVVVDTFTIPEQGLSGADTFQIDLLEYQGVHQLLIMEDQELAAASYSAILIAILDDGINQSYVQLSDDSLVEITVSGGSLTVPGMQLSSGTQKFTVEFSLAQALQYQSSSGKYLLATNGIRVDNNSTAATLSGEIDSSLFDSEIACAEKTDPEKGNRVYLYKGVGLSTDSLADVFTSNSSTTVPDGSNAPFDVAAIDINTLTGNWQYAFGYLPAGDYTLAFSCNTEDDHAVNYDGRVIPLPSDQVYEITLSESDKAVCNLAEGASC